MKMVPITTCNIPPRVYIDIIYSIIRKLSSLYLHGKDRGGDNSQGTSGGRS